MQTCDKAVSEQGVRLHTNPAALRGWRHEFARHLREQGIAANATERAVRGEARTHTKDGIYRATRRGESTHARARITSVAADVMKGHLGDEPGKGKLMETRRQVQGGWRAVSDMLTAQGYSELAARVDEFLDQMPPVRTDRERLAAALRARIAAKVVGPVATR